MIASLRGKVQSRTAGSVILDVQGVGYQVNVPTLISNSVEVGQDLFLLTTLIVREDSSQLFGFDSTEQQGLFDLLRSVSGVGPKTALNVLATLSPAEISMAVTSEDSKPFESVSGVGVKTAKLINVTLAGKLQSHAKSVNSQDTDLLSALQSLGWKERVALPIVEKVTKTAGEKDLATLIRECLALLGK